MPPEPAGPIGQATAVFEAFDTLAVNCWNGRGEERWLLVRCRPKLEA